MKYKEKVSLEDDKLIIKNSHNLDPALKRASQIRELGVTDVGEDSKFIGTIPMPLLESWIKEAGVSWTDDKAMEEVIKKKILSGDFDKFRSDWKGSW